MDILLYQIWNQTTSKRKSLEENTGQRNSSLDLPDFRYPDSLYLLCSQYFCVLSYCKPWRRVCFEVTPLAGQQTNNLGNVEYLGHMQTAQVIYQRGATSIWLSFSVYSNTRPRWNASRTVIRMVIYTAARMDPYTSPYTSSQLLPLAIFCLVLPG